MVITVTVNGGQGEGKSSLAAKIVAFLESEGVACFAQDGEEGDLNAHRPAEGCRHVAMVTTKLLPPLAIDLGDVGGRK